MEDPGLEKPLGLVTAGYTLSSRPTDILQRGWSSQRWQKGAFFDYLDLHGVLVAQPPGRIKGGGGAKAESLVEQLGSITGVPENAGNTRGGDSMSVEAANASEIFIGAHSRRGGFRENSLTEHSG